LLLRVNEGTQHAEDHEQANNRTTEQAASPDWSTHGQAEKISQADQFEAMAKIGTLH